MATWNSFEDIEAWQKARQLNIIIYKVVRSLKNDREYELAKQIIRSAGSITDNLAEGFERDGTREFRQFVSIAKGSTGELKSQVIRIKDFELIKENDFQIIIPLINEISRMLGGLLKYLNSIDHRGKKYK